MIVRLAAARLGRGLALVAVSALALALLVAPEYRAVPAGEPGGVIAGRADAPVMGAVAGSDMAVELAYQRLKSLGLARVDAREVVDAVMARESFAAVDARIGASLGAPESLDASAVVRLLASRLEPGARLADPGALALAFGLGPELGIDPESLRTFGRDDGRELAPGSAPSQSATPSLNGTCLTCPAFDFGCFTPTGTWQFHSSSLGPGFSDCNWYCFDVVAGTTYEFTTCPSVSVGPDTATANFDPAVDLFRPPAVSGPCTFKGNSDDNCGPQPESPFLSWVADFTGSVHLRIRGIAGASGDYTLAYRKICPAASTCSAPDGTLLPTTTCQYQAGVVDDCTDDRFYSVMLISGRTYNFDLGNCVGCPGSSASFDSFIELSIGGTPVASSSGCGGDDGGVSYTPAIDSSGCVRVHREGGAGNDFQLGYSVNCQPPGTVLVAPDTASTIDPNCLRDQRFTVTTFGTPDLTYAWTIVPPAGASATPAAGSTTSAANLMSFNSMLQGDGTYVVTVTVSNSCGTAVGSVNFLLEDRAGPEITATADPINCGTAPFTRRARVLDRIGSIGREEILHALMASPDPSEVEEALARKLGVASSSLVVIDSRDPGFFRPPGAAAVSCGTPCTSGTLSASNPYYNVYMDCNNGAFTAGTGASHSVTISSGASQNVIFNGGVGSPGTSDITFHVHDTNENYLDPTGGRTCVFDPPDTAAEPNSQGVESEWTRTTTDGEFLTLREEIVAFGSSEPNSGVRLTLSATNSPASPSSVTMGVRWQIDYQNGGDDGPWYAEVVCGPPFEVDNERSTEYEFSDAEVDAQDFYRIQNNTGDPIFGNFTNTTALAGFDGTGKPDRLVYGRWPTMSGSAWNYGTTVGADADWDSAVLYYFGYDVADGIVLAPGESFTRSVVIFTAGDAQDCGSFRPGTCEGAVLEICPGDCAQIGATAVDNCGSATIALTGTSAGAPACTGNPCIVSFPDEGTYVYTWTATDDQGNTAECTSTVNVVNSAACNQPPTASAGTPAASACREATIVDASVEDPNDDGISYVWTSDRSDVTITPATGFVPGTPDARPLPPTLVSLDPATSPCGVVATLTLSVDDGAGGTASDTTTVTFDDTLPPVLSAVVDVTVECDAVPAAPPVATLDACDANPSLTFTERRVDGSCPGSYTLIRTWESTDACANVASVQQTVTVVDTTPPVVTATGGPIACLWPPNHWYVAFNAADLNVTVVEACSEPVTWQLSGCASDQPDDAPESGFDGWNGDGNTENDCVVSPDGQTLYVRSERCGTGPTADSGRHYSVLVVATDACGNSSAPVPAGSILVPHDQSPANKSCRNPTKDGVRELP